MMTSFATNPVVRTKGIMSFVSVTINKAIAICRILLNSIETVKLLFVQGSLARPISLIKMHLNINTIRAVVFWFGETEGRWIGLRGSWLTAAVTVNGGRDQRSSHTAAVDSLDVDSSDQGSQTRGQG